MVHHQTAPHGGAMGGGVCTWEENRVEDYCLDASTRTADGFWESTTLMEIASEVSKPVALDDFPSRQRKARFARLRVELDSVEPLKPGISIW